MITQRELEILMCFFPTITALTSKEIEERSGLSHETTFRQLKKLVQKKFLREKKVGKTNVYEFMKEDRDIAYQAFTAYMARKRFAFKQKHALLYRRLYEFLDEVNPEGPAIVFGSFAKGIQTKQSDVDLLCTTGNKKISKTAAEFKTKYGINLQLIAIKPSDFKNIKIDNPQFWHDLIEYGIVLDGMDLFFKEAYVND